MIRNINIGSIMTPGPVCIEADLKLERAKERMEAYKIRQLPVTRFGRLAGVLSFQKIKALRWNPARFNLKVEDIMDVDPYIVSPCMSAEEVVRDMFEQKLEHALITVDEKTPIGIFTRQDALKLLLTLPRDEETMGECLPGGGAAKDGKGAREAFAA